MKILLGLALLYGLLCITGWLYRAVQPVPTSAFERCIAAHPGSDREAGIARMSCPGL